MTKCIACHETFVLEPGKVTEIMKDNQGNNMQPIHRRHYAENRIKCPACQVEQCRTCHSRPYHIGFTCQKYAEFIKSRHCRYCNAAITEVIYDEPALRDVCKSGECAEKAALACRKILKCGHPCPGHQKEAECIACLDPECEKDLPEGAQKGDDYCNICFVEDLRSAPCVKIGCGHIFHYHCLKTRIEMKWHTPRIFFTFCECPLCKKWIKLEEDSPIAELLKQLTALYEDVRGRSVQRLKYEGMEKDPKLVDPNSVWHGRPEEYAMAVFSYYLCFKCKKPYFGGKKNCEDAAADQNRRREFKESELVCPGCSDVGEGQKKCAQHGVEYISYKCRFCCSLALWFCFGTTHFCEPCHRRAGEVDRLPKNRLPKCPGREGCPLAVDHPANGVEYSLGCGLCKERRDGAKADF
eukprot:TRINITY_DN8351_c0_g1_i1.p1 TRINITY_DN8351_c0_g1~~TRINITY_DN8351_c0_g1_i1.p1  ORF type:complete len:410 (+),score=32.69 TRINITY_DN8351_c0_g1_i1:307-1536(+)